MGQSIELDESSRVEIKRLRLELGLKASDIHSRFPRPKRSLIARFIRKIEWEQLLPTVRTVRFLRILGLTLPAIGTKVGWSSNRVRHYVADLDAEHAARLEKEIVRLRPTHSVDAICQRLHCSRERVVRCSNDPRLSTIERLRLYLLEHPMEEPISFARLFPEWPERTFYYHVKQLTPLVRGDNYVHPLTNKAYYTVEKLAQMSGRTAGGVSLLVSARRVNFVMVRRPERKRPVRLYSFTDFLEKVF